MFTPQFLRGTSALLSLLFSFSLLFSQGNRLEKIPYDDFIHDNSSPATFTAKSVAKRFGRRIFSELVYFDVSTISSSKHGLFIPDGDFGYVVLDNFFIRSYSSPLSQLEKDLVIFHELSHLLLNHHWKLDVSKLEMEIDADHLSGFLLAVSFDDIDLDLEDSMYKNDKKLKKHIQEAIDNLYGDMTQSPDYLPPAGRASKIIQGYDLGIRTLRSGKPLTSILPTFSTYIAEEDVDWNRLTDLYWKSPLRQYEETTPTNN